MPKSPPQVTKPHFLSLLYIILTFKKARQPQPIGGLFYVPTVDISVAVYHSNFVHDNYDNTIFNTYLTKKYLFQKKFLFLEFFFVPE